jgi:HD-GYP domain-containing protein (c-di-GMP phosphodiesterase class II)
MIADRPSRAGLHPGAAREELMACAGSHFDPAVVDAFLGNLEADAGARSRPALGVR